MFELIVGAWKSTVDAASLVMKRLWGDQTSQEASLMKRAEQAEAEFRTASARLREANARGDEKAKSVALSDCNSWKSELTRLHAEAAAKRTD